MNKPQQSKHNSIWISANAGSGKTTFLTRRVVGLLLAGVQSERICCITYTKAAASEMRGRVLGMLRHLLLADDRTAVTHVTDLLGRAPTLADMERARSLFGLVLDSTTGGLQLTTIHGFCQSILRRFPLEAEIAPHFTVLDEAASARLLNQAKHRLLGADLSKNRELAEALNIIGLRGSESRFDDYLADIIRKRTTWEGLTRVPAARRARIFALHGLGPEVTEEGLLAQLYALPGSAHAAVIREHLPQLFAHKNKNEQENAPILATWLEALPNARAALADDFCGIFLTDKGELRKAIFSKKDFPEGSPLWNASTQIAQQVLTIQQQLASLACAEESYAVSLLAEALLTLYAQAKEAIHALDYDDLIGKTRQLFANPSLLGWVMSKLDHRIDHLLIDEAQDTSAEQWSIAQLLVEELIAANEGLGSGNVPRSLLVVGDEKQSIYSFQGAAPELFASKQGDFQQMLDGSPSPLAYEELANSYRSAEAVLKLVNHVAAMPEIAPALSASGISAPHQLKRPDAVGSVTLYPAIPAPEKEGLPPLTMPTEYQLSKSAAQLLADSVADTVHDWLEQKRLLESEGRPITPGDILILVYRRKPIVMPLIRALQRHGIPVAGLDRLTLSEHLAVRDLLALMRWVTNPSDDLALAHSLRSSIINLTDEALRALCVKRTGSLWAELKTQPLLETALSMRSATPYDFLTAILETNDARRRFAAAFGEEVHEVLDEFKAQAAAIPEGVMPTLAGFHDWMSASNQQVKREQEGKSDKVRIMTVHGAKGLEAPIVMLVDTVKVPTTKDELVFFTPSEHNQLLPLVAISDEAKQAPMLALAKQRKASALLAEYDRLLYVALTRACDELHLFGTGNKKGEVPENSWYQIVKTALEQLGATSENGQLKLKDARAAAAAPRRALVESEITALPQWAKQNPAPAQPEMRAASPSDLAPSAMVSAYASSGSGDLRARGVRIHRILECIDGESDAASIAQLVRWIAPDWNAEEQHRAIAEVSALLATERWIWQSPSHAEVNISGMITIDRHQIPIAGQIDRLVETPDAIVILDYKTGQHVPASPDEISENYRVQLKAYEALVRQLYPTKPIRCAILWTATPTLMWCDAIVAATPWPKQFVIESQALVA